MILFTLSGDNFVSLCASFLVRPEVYAGIWKKSKRFILWYLAILHWIIFQIYEYPSLKMNIFSFMMFCSLLGTMFKLLSYTYWFFVIEWSKLLHTLKYHFFRSLFRKAGWESISGESHLNALLRGEVFLALATFGHDKTHREAIQRFQTLLNDRNTHLLSADTRRVSFTCIS